MNNSIKEVTVVIVSHKSKKKVLNLVKNISSNFKIIIVENSYDKSIESEVLNLHKNTRIFLNFLRINVYFEYSKKSTWTCKNSAVDGT